MDSHCVAWPNPAPTESCDAMRTPRDPDRSQGVSTIVLCDLGCVIWDYEVPKGQSADAIAELFVKTADIYIGVPGLIRKYFGHSDDLRSVVGIYLWESKAHADAFYSPEWIAGVKSRWGSLPAKAEWVVPQVVESAERRVITSKARTLDAAE